MQQSSSRDESPTAKRRRTDTGPTQESDQFICTNPAHSPACLRVPRSSAGRPDEVRYDSLESCERACALPVDALAEIGTSLTRADPKQWIPNGTGQAMPEPWTIVLLLHREVLHFEKPDAGPASERLLQQMINSCDPKLRAVQLPLRVVEKMPFPEGWSDDGGWIHADPVASYAVVDKGCADRIAQWALDLHSDAEPGTAFLGRQLKDTHVWLRGARYTDDAGAEISTLAEQTSGATNLLPRRSLYLYGTYSDVY